MKKSTLHFILLMSFVFASIVGLRYIEYNSVQEPRYAKIMNTGKECRKSCFYYALVNYNDDIQKVNIGKRGFKNYKSGQTYDFTPQFNFFFGASGYAYAVELPYEKSVLFIFGKSILFAMFFAFMFSFFITRLIFSHNHQPN